MSGNEVALFQIQFLTRKSNSKCRDVTTGATAVAPKFSDTLILSQPRGADSAHHRRGRSLHFPVVTSLEPVRLIE